jgi:uncharacterized protein (TIGR03032 family)
MSEEALDLEMDRNFVSWIKTQRYSILASSYRTGSVFCLGFTTIKETKDNILNEQLSFWTTSEIRCMGMTTTNNGKTVWISSKNRLTKYDHYGTEKEETDTFVRSDFDGIYIPRKIHITGDIDVHDIVIPDGSSEPCFVNALHSCICTPSDNASFKVYWKPPWISKIAAEDRTHLNGLCCLDGVPRYVTACAMTDIRGGWREHSNSGGVIYDIIENLVVCKDLSMPHSPRMRPNDPTKIWVLNSGRGDFGYVDLEETLEDGTHPFIAKCFVPAYLRGMAFIGEDYALVGGSEDRHERVFSNLPLGEILKEKGDVKARCGIFVINMKTFDIVHEFTFKKGVKELYDIVTIPHIIRPKIYESFDHASIEGLISIEELQ